MLTLQVSQPDFFLVLESGFMRRPAHLLTFDLSVIVVLTCNDDF